MDCIWCTLVMLNDNYVAGAAVVAKSIKNSKSKYPVWCMIAGTKDRDVSNDCISFLETQFDKVVRVPIIEHAVEFTSGTTAEKKYSPWMKYAFTKWTVLNPQIFPVEKVLFIDADSLVTENCDHLFDLPGPAMTFSMPYYTTYGGFAVDVYGKMKHGSVVDRKKLLNALTGRNKTFACAGDLALLYPNYQTYKKFRALLTDYPTFNNKLCLSAADEQSLCLTLLELNIDLYNIHQKYNWYVTKPNWLDKDTKAVVYQWLIEKPWDLDPLTTDYPEVKEWWKVAEPIKVIHSKFFKF